MFEQWPIGPVRGVAFDAVGTLIEPYPSVATAYADAARRQGVELDRGEVKRRFQRHFRNDEVDEFKGPLVTDEDLEYRRWRRIVTNVLPELPDPSRAFDELWTHFGRPDAWRVFPDVAPALARLRAASVAYNVASNFDGRLRSVLAGLPDLSDLVETAVVSSLVGHRKPHPRFYQAVCERFGAAPAQVLYVGDDLENDVKGPEHAGLVGLLVHGDDGARRLDAIAAALAEPGVSAPL